MAEACLPSNVSAVPTEDQDTNSRRYRNVRAENPRLPRQTVYNRRQKRKRLDCSPEAADAVPSITELTQPAVTSDSSQIQNVLSTAHLLNDPEIDIFTADTTSLCGYPHATDTPNPNSDLSLDAPTEIDSPLDSSMDCESPIPSPTIIPISPTPSSASLSDQESDVLDSEYQSEDEERLYPEATITKETSLLLVTAYANRHKISKIATDDLLKLLRLHCPVPNNCFPSFHCLQAHSCTSSTTDLNIVQHFFCPDCFIPILNPNDVSTCPNTSCKKALEPKTMSFFLELPVLPQVQQLFSSPNFCNHLQYYNNRKKLHTNNLEEISDGIQYQKMIKSGLLGHAHAVSFTLNTDGVIAFQSQCSTYSFWPIFLMVNELPLKERKKEDKTVLAGVWFGKSKPYMLTYLQQLATSLIDLAHNGLDVHCRDCNIDVNIHGYLLGISCDLPARATVLNSVQFNGFYGCNHCEQPGVSYTTENKGCVHIYPYMKDDPKGPPRTSSSINALAREAGQQKKAVKGIKGPSWLSCLDTFDMVQGVAIDYMHGALLGVTKLLLNLWLKSKESLWFVPEKEIDKRIAGILVPDSVNPLPRGVSERKHWKAKEYRSWLLFYSLPVLNGILRREYFEHFALLVVALWLLLQSSISPEEANHAELLLNHFCFKLPIYYGERYMLSNVHQLLHLPDCVRNMGPLWCYSCFIFENLNGRLKRHFHGTQAPHLQIINSVRDLKFMSARAATFLQDERVTTTQKAFYRRMTNCTPTERCEQSKLFSDCYVMGKLKPASLTAEEQRILNSTFTIQRNMFTYKQALLHGHNVYSMDYQSRSTKRNKTIVSFTTQSRRKYGRVMKFIVFCTSNCSENCHGCHHVAFVELLHIRETSLFTDQITNAKLEHIKICQSSSKDIQVINIADIWAPVVVAKFPDKHDTLYVADLPNLSEINL